MMAKLGRTGFLKTCRGYRPNEVVRIIRTESAYSIRARVKLNTHIKAVSIDASDIYCFEIIF